MTRPPNTTDRWRVTLRLVGGGTVELTSSSEPRSHDNGEIEADWINDPRRGTLGHINWTNVAVVTWRKVKPDGFA